MPPVTLLSVTAATLSSRLSTVSANPSAATASLQPLLLLVPRVSLPLRSDSVSGRSALPSLAEKVSSKNFVGLEGLTPSELAAHFPEKTMWKNSDEIVAERKMGFQTYLDSMAKHSGSNTDVRDLLRVFLMGDA